MWRYVLVIPGDGDFDIKGCVKRVDGPYWLQTGKSNGGGEGFWVEIIELISKS